MLAWTEADAMGAEAVYRQLFPEAAAGRLAEACREAVCNARPSANRAADAFDLRAALAEFEARGGAG